MTENNKTAQKTQLESGLDQKYDLLRLGVISSNSVASRTGALIRHLSQPSEGDKAAVASLHARSAAANKLISAVEIAKRDLKAKGERVYQYSSLTTERVLMKAKAPGPGRSGSTATLDAPPENAADDMDEDFEVMRPKDKLQETPVLTVYLSLVPVKELQNIYGEQVD
ncbi:hypothetical protein AAFC00_002566 [Neodothiora populina]|uniref:Uncharacterized protein n=1 Tax=Neodothiora populina TaxID=2781224 RepID=A0ABR3P7H9_9PEZI